MDFFGAICLCISCLTIVVYFAEDWRPALLSRKGLLVCALLGLLSGVAGLAVGIALGGGMLVISGLAFLWLYGWIIRDLLRELIPGPLSQRKAVNSSSTLTLLPPEHADQLEDHGSSPSNV